jgi:DNA polymerase III subunit beta
MKITVLQENLAKAVGRAFRFASTRSQLPILGNVLLMAEKTKLNISATNLEISVSTSMGAKIEEEGSLSIPAKVLNELIGNLPNGTLLLKSDKEQLEVSSKGFDSKILGMNANDFPKVPNSIDKEKAISIEKKKLLESLPQVMFASGTDETRPVLTGVLLIMQKTSLTLVATDGFRLSRKKIQITSSKEGNVIIPKGILMEVAKAYEDSEEISFDFKESDKQVIFGTEDVVLTSRLLEGTYPDFEKIIPISSSINVKVDKEEFMRGVKLAAIFAREAANVIRLNLSGDSLTVTAESSASGSQETVVDAKVDGDIGKKFEIAFNCKFLEDFLHSVKGGEVRIDFTTSDKAAVFTDTSDQNYLHLIMPVKIQG